MKSRLKKFTRGCLTLILLGALASILLGWPIKFGRNLAEVAEPTATVIVINEIHYNFPVKGIVDYYIPSSVNLRSEPSFDNNFILTTVEDGEEFLLLGITRDGLFFITEYEGQTVFVSVKAITLEE